LKINLDKNANKLKPCSPSSSIDMDSMLSSTAKFLTFEYPTKYKRFESEKKLISDGI